MSNPTISIAECYIQKAKSAKKAGKRFEMSFTNFANLKSQTHCAYSGVEFEQSGDHTFSFERIDCNVGYVDGNVIPVSRFYNTLRSNIAHSDDVQKVVNNLKSDIGTKLKELENQREQLAHLMCLQEKYSADATPIVESKRIVKVKVRSDHPKLNTVWHLVEMHVGLGKKIERDKQLISQFKNQIEEMMMSSKSKENKVKAISSHKLHIQNLEKKIVRNKHLLGKGMCKSHKAVWSSLNFVELETKEIVGWKKKVDHSDAIAAKQNTIAEIEKWLENSQKRLNGYPVIYAALKRFENLSRMERFCVEMGYPLDTRPAKVYKQKLANKLSNKIY